MIKIAPSILSADFSALGEACDKMKEWGADYVHLDVMDGSFVNNITFGHGMVKALRKHTSVTFDAHLMVENPVKWVPYYKDAGADIFTFHVEADRHIHRTIQTIKKHEMKAGVALNPATPLCMVEYVLEDCDMVLLMSVNPGAPAQKFIPSTIEKIRRLREMADERGLKLDIEVDGGVNEHTAPHCIAAGANILVAGNAVFSADDPKRMIRILKGEE
ncbi:MAG: ribulose-phosphate 3-epimerase [Clostridia bacterium]|nr:ribulose-phosphate 3-epimerase [Clostridia bacterium]